MPKQHARGGPGRTSPLAATLVAPAVAVVLVAGIWVAGGAVTDDFTASMLLTAAWIGVVGVACRALAWRRRQLRLPLIAAYLITVAVVGAYLGRSTLIDDRVMERVVTAAPPATDADRDQEPKRGERERPALDVQVRSGRFTSLAHPARGRASVIDLADGGRVLTLTGFEVDNGPDLRVYLVAGDPRRARDFEDLGALKGNSGDQQYRIPRDVDVGQYSTAVVWCRAFSVAFASADLEL